MQRIRHKLANKDRNKDHTVSEIDVTQQSVNVLLVKEDENEERYQPPERM